MSLDEARRVMKAEAEAIGELAAGLGESFLRAVGLIVECAGRSGRVVVTGMGKAGIVGQRFAATLSSTGTPAFSLHPAEAVHGDLGMLQQSDLLVILSKSGETREIVDLLRWVKQFKVKILGLTASSQSVLGQDSDHVVELGRIEEVDPELPVPSSSATAMSALCDALAFCVLKRRGFTSGEYLERHPGGMGWRMKHAVREVMRTGERCPLATADVPIGQVIGLISQARCGAACVVDDERRLLGIFTDGDFRRAYAKDMEVGSHPVGEHMTSPCASVSQAAKIEEAQGLMHTKRINALPVVDAERRVVGLLDIQDVVS